MALLTKEPIKYTANDPSGQFGQIKDGSVDNSLVYKREQADGSSVKTNYPHISSVQKLLA